MPAQGPKTPILADAKNEFASIELTNHVVGFSRCHRDRFLREKILTGLGTRERNGVVEIVRCEVVYGVHLRRMNELFVLRKDLDVCVWLERAEVFSPMAKGSPARALTGCRWGVLGSLRM